MLREGFQAPFNEIAATGDTEGGLRRWIGQIGEVSIGPGAVFMAHWYASLYVVVEGWQSLGFTDPVIDALIASEHTSRLRVHRNATCHFHKTLRVDKWNRFEQEPGAVEWVRSLDREFGRYFLEQTKMYAENFLAEDIPQRERQLAQAFLEMFPQQKSAKNPEE